VTKKQAAKYSNKNSSIENVTQAAEAFSLVCFS